MDVYLTIKGALNILCLLYTSTILPMIFVCKAATRPAKYRNMNLLKCLNYIISHSVCVRNRRIFSYEMCIRDRPCLPITLPISLGATFSSSTSPFSVSFSVTTTSSGSVSYTHLDVYKRQRIPIRARSIRLINLSFLPSNNVL